MTYEIKELGLGGILDQSIAIVKNHFGLLFSIMLLLLIPFTLATGFVTTAMMPKLPPEPTIQDYARIQKERAANWPLFVGLGAVNLCLVYPLTNAAVIHAVARVYLGQPVTAIDAYKHAFRRFLPLVGTSILMMLAIWVGFLLLIIPGIYFSIWFGLSQNVAVLENASGAAALRRSKQLVNPKRGQFLALGIVMGVISMGVGWSAALIPQPHLSLVASSLLTAVTTMLWTASGVVFYFSARCALENFDLQFLADSIGADTMSADLFAPRGAM